MLPALYEVIIDLWRFVFSWVSRQKVHEAKVLELAPPSLSHHLTERFVEKHIDILHTPVSGQQAYVIKKAGCFVQPAFAFDTKLRDIIYGEVVTVLTREGDFLKVTAKDSSGWVHIQGLTFDKHDITPSFVPEHVYGKDSLETKKVRLWLQDECSGGLLGLPLQGVEFILYQLFSRKIVIDWMDFKPRTPGTWQVFLKGRIRVHMSVDPKTGSVMEYFKDDNIGVLAFVESVHPDQSIIVRSVGIEKDGEYRIDILTQAQLRELRPVFISFS